MALKRGQFVAFSRGSIIAASIAFAVNAGTLLAFGLVGGEAGHNAFSTPWSNNPYVGIFVLAAVELIVPFALGFAAGRYWAAAVPALSFLAAYVMNAVLSDGLFLLTPNGGFFEFLGAWIFYASPAALICLAGAALRQKARGQ